MLCQRDDEKPGFVMSTLVTDSLRKSNTSLLWSVISSRYHPDRAWRSRPFCLKFILRCCCYPRISYRYLRALTGLDMFPGLLARQGLLPAKIHRPYLSAGLGVQQRAEAIVSHYQLLAGLVNPQLQQILGQPAGRPLLQWHSSEGQAFTLSCGPARFDREGEVMLCLSYQQQVVATITFALIRQAEKSVLFIGGLQGPGPEVPAEIIRQATRAAYGIFPKRLLMDVIFWLAAAGNIDAIQAVSENSHVFRSLRYRYSKQDKFFASYSEFWESRGGRPNLRGNYDLPLQVIRKPLEEVVSKKRAEYRRRYQLLAQLQQQFNDALGITGK